MILFMLASLEEILSKIELLQMTTVEEAVEDT